MGIFKSFRFSLALMVFVFVSLLLTLSNVCAPAPPCTPAMAAGVSKTLWSLTDMVRVIEDRETLRDGTRLVG